MSQKRKINTNTYKYSDCEYNCDYDSDETVVIYRSKDRKTFITSSVPQKYDKDFVFVKEPHLNVTSHGAFSNSEKALRRRQYRKKKKKFKKSHKVDSNESHFYSRKVAKCEFNRSALKDIKNINEVPLKGENISIEI
jgi:hypothetical protein